MPVPSQASTCVAVEVAASASTVTSSHPLASLGLAAHGGQLRPIAADIGHLMRDDQMVLGIDGDLHVVADNARALAAGRHRARIGIGQRDLLVGRGLNLLAISLRDCICRRRPAIFSLRRVVFASAISPSSRSARSKAAR